MKKYSFSPVLILSLFMTFVLFPLAVQAQEEDPSKWTVKDVINQESAYGLEFSPDGQSLVWVKRRPDREKDRFVSDLYLTRLDINEDGSYKTVQLTRG
ncbi:MAG: hypothetical protein R3222_03465, partial [Balneolaceae bacterium]|nr:hypothetical protein [Balneolaceae bacterium]